MRVLPLLLTAATLLAAAVSTSYQDVIDRWRRNYEEKLKAPDNWLSVAGLFWLHEGQNTVGSDPKSDIVLPKDGPQHLGMITLKGKQAALHVGGKEQALVADKDPVQVGDLSLALLTRNHRYAIRLRDPNADSRRNFTGIKWYPVKPEYRIEARWIPYNPPHKMTIPTILGYSEQQDAPGYAEFELHGKKMRLEPYIEEPGTLFFIFKDQTAGHETYPAGRFLDAADPHDGKVILDFNQSRNPPCAFTAFATCPLPPKQNILSTRIEAGSLKYGHH